MLVSPITTSERVEALLAQMTLAEKIGQMTQPERQRATPQDVTTYAVGSVLSGGGSNPTPNTPHHWAQMVREYNRAALATRLKIPLMYGVDAVHGHNNCLGAVIFPHNIGLGATGNADLVERIGRVTADEMLATHANWNFAPCLAVPQDPRWGRTYEGYAGDPALVGELGAAYTRGLQSGGVAACVKHFVGDGGAEWNTHRRASWVDFWERAGGLWKIDQGDVNVDEPTFRRIHLAPYLRSIELGALTVMASFSSWRGLKMHASRYLLTDVLKGELGFDGFIVTDWMGIHQLSPDYYTCVMMGINAGIDMVMEPQDFKLFISTLTQAVERGDVPLSRVDDAVRRILSVKERLGLFDATEPDRITVESVGSAEHRAVAREAVRQSLVLLKNQRDALPLRADGAPLLVAGRAADNIGLQCGGWTVEWTGGDAATVPGDTLLAALRHALPDSDLRYSADGVLTDATPRAAVGVVVVAEKPYAEGIGDAEDLTLPAEDVALIERVRVHCDRLILVIYSGRPLVITAVEPLCDAIVAAWLPGSEGAGIADVLTGAHPFVGKLPQPWIASMDQVPFSVISADNPPLYPMGHGLALE